ncbi:MAG: hypothetical protein H6721_31285 [Sandaracinus sp.]|nr:hypothetical protein [Sandaracinus sp.]MCB9613348.1 hypothetical protein [Sandaracinus sp.]MCB9636616.1 hypothetical protein [Sandaracinus sp.]
MRAAFLTAACLAMGCLVTDKVELPEERNFPPSVVTMAAEDAPTIDRIVTFDLADGLPQLELPVVVRDPNVDQSLEYQLWVDFEGNVSALVSDRDARIAPTGTLERSTTLRVPATRLTPAPSCHRIELLVTGEFDGGTRFRDPVEDGDISQTVWWVRVIDSIGNPGGNAIDLSSCP